MGWSAPRASCLSQDVATRPEPKGQRHSRTPLPYGGSVFVQTPFYRAQAGLGSPLTAAVHPGILHSSANWDSPLKILGCLSSDTGCPVPESHAQRVLFPSYL